ncbi:MAG: hypothetical protein AAF358_21470 [Pseudomonadota bacterium]
MPKFGTDKQRVFERVADAVHVDKRLFTLGARQRLKQVLAAGLKILVDTPLQ